MKFITIPQCIKKNRVELFRIAFALFSAIAAYIFISFYMVNVYNLISIEMTSDTETDAVVYIAAKEDIPFSEQRTSRPVSIHKGRETYKFFINNSTLAKFRFDPAKTSGNYEIHSIQILSFFAPEIAITPDYPDKYIAVSSDTELKRDGQNFILKSSGEDPNIAFNSLPKNPLSIRLWITILCISLFIYFISIYAIPYFDIRKWPAYQDTFHKKPSTGKNFGSLDGLRGLAALFVFSVHSNLNLSFYHIGEPAVTIFFVLSGFLLTLPYTQKENSLLSLPEVTLFWLRRVLRIFPMFFTYLLIAYLFQGNTGEFFRSIFFLDGSGVLWTVIHEVHYYLLLPLLLILCRFLSFGNPDVGAVFFLILSLLSLNGILPNFELSGNGNSLPFMFWIFCGGSMTAFLYRSRFMQLSFIRTIVTHNITGFVLVALLTFSGVVHSFILRNILDTNSFDNIYGIRYYFWASLLILHLIFAPETNIISRFFSSSFLRFLGVVSYSFYLLHNGCICFVQSVLLEVFSNPGRNIESFVLSFLLAMGLSIAGYTLIERPFIKK